MDEFVEADLNEASTRSHPRRAAVIVSAAVGIVVLLAGGMLVSPLAPAVSTVFFPRSIAADVPAPALARYTAPQDGGDGATLTGTLVDVKGCLYVKSTDQVTLAILPVDATMSGNVLSAGGPTFELGDRISIGGGEGDANMLKQSAITVPAACDTSRLWLSNGAPAPAP